TDVPDHRNDQERLDDPKGTGLDDLKKEDACPKDHKPSLDIVFGSNGLHKPARDADGVTDDQSDKESKNYVLQPPVVHRRVARNHVGEPRKNVYDRKADNVFAYVSAHERNANGGEDQESDADLDCTPEAFSAEHAAHHGSRPSTYHPVNVGSLFVARCGFRLV